MRRLVPRSSLSIGLALTLLGSWMTVAAATPENPAQPIQGERQAFHGVRFVPTAAPPTTGDRYYFTGSPGDQAAKVAGSPSATFTQDEAAGSDIIQVADSSTEPAGASNEPGNPATAFWTGSFSGTLNGDIQIEWWWDTANLVSTVLPMQFDVAVFADPDLAAGGDQSDKIIGRATAQITIGPAGQPQQNLTTVPVDGAVSGVLHIQATSQYIDAGHALEVHYGSAQFPSNFLLPSADGGGGGGGSEPPVEEPQSVPATDYAGDPLVLEATYVGRDSAEPTIGITHDGTVVYAAGAFDAEPVFGALARTEVYRSRDHGYNWESVQPAPPGGVTTGPPTTLDPYVYVDQTTDRIFNVELYGACSYLNYSDDGGDTFQTNPAFCGDFVNDHQTVGTGPPSENLVDRMGDYPNVVYYCFNRVADSNCGRSLDGGETFDFTQIGGEPAFLGYDPAAGGLCGGLHGHIDIDNEGRLFIPKGHCSFPWTARSEDGGETWQQFQVSDQLTASAQHLAMAHDDFDNLYFVWWDEENRLPWLATSTNHGETWSQPLMIAPPGVKDVNFPVIAAGAPGHIAITFPGTTFDATSDDGEDAPLRPWNSYVVMSTNALDPDPLFLSATANEIADPIHRGDCDGRCAGMFDFLDIVLSPQGEIWATATDTCTEEQDECVSVGTSADDAEGVAIRQVGGPDLRPGQQPTDPPSPQGGPTPPAPAPSSSPSTQPGGGTASPTSGGTPGTSLPSTGGGIAGAAIALVGAALALSSRRRRHD